jgi:ketosteroid isomerase-like protein
VLSAYASAYSSLDAGAVKRVYPAVNEQDLKRRFADIRSQQVQIQNEQIAVSGDAATVTCTVITVFQGQVGASRRISLQAVFRLEKRNNAWVIVSRQ